MHATGFFRGCCLLTTTFAWRSLTAGTIFPIVFHVEKLFPDFWYTLPLPGSKKKSACVIERIISVCALTRIYITCTSTNYVDVPELPRPRGRGRSYS